MILTDSSVIIDHASGKDAKLSVLMPTLPVAICGVVRAEVLGGARSPKERRTLHGMLGAFRQVATPEPVWDLVGDHRAKLRSKGVSVPFTDVVIAALAMDLDVEVWTRDKQFILIQQVLPALRLYQEPT